MHTPVSGLMTQDTYVKNKTGGGPVIDEWYDYANIQKGSTVIIDSISYYLSMVMLGQGPLLQIGSVLMIKT